MNSNYKKDPRPNRRKDKYNPYEIFSVGIETDDPHFYVKFVDVHGVTICQEINQDMFMLLDKFTHVKLMEKKAIYRGKKKNLYKQLLMTLKGR